MSALAARAGDEGFLLCTQVFIQSGSHSKRLDCNVTTAR